MPKTLKEIRMTPRHLLTDEEVKRLGPGGQYRVRQYREQRAREEACVGHEPVEIPIAVERRCKHCGADLRDID